MQFIPITQTSKRTVSILTDNLSAVIPTSRIQKTFLVWFYSRIDNLFHEFQTDAITQFTYHFSNSHHKKPYL